MPKITTQRYYVWTLVLGVFLSCSARAQEDSIKTIHFKNASKEYHYGIPFLYLQGTDYEAGLQYERDQRQHIPIPSHAKPMATDCQHDVRCHNPSPMWLDLGAGYRRAWTQRVSLGRPWVPAHTGARGSPFQMPTRLADGLGPESDRDGGSPPALAPSLVSQGLVPPH